VSGGETLLSANETQVTYSHYLTSANTMPLPGRSIAKRTDRPFDLSIHREGRSP